MKGTLILVTGVPVCDSGPTGSKMTHEHISISVSVRETQALFQEEARRFSWLLKKRLAPFKCWTLFYKAAWIGKGCTFAQFRLNPVDYGSCASEVVLIILSEISCGFLSLIK